MTRTEREITCRPARPGDQDAISAIDASFATDTVFEVTTAEDGFTLRSIPVDPPLRKIFPEDDAQADPEPAGMQRFVAVHGDLVCGFADVRYESWNRRLTIADIAVSPAHRGRGAGRALLERALEHGRRAGAGHLWLEVTHVNAPAIRAYLRMGFRFCGLDTSLYQGTASAGEVALFMSRPC
ncbi:GNAT family N-acetyltransferase [Streptomyces sp. NPDC052396]|uniref:GNAT family N-acetyltransferase n=1 Tax=Streptomyces sp. NPDC052396 TaxID=3365689 RepID=UPI0037D010DE